MTKRYHLGITCKRIPVKFKYTLDGKLISTLQLTGGYLFLIIYLGTNIVILFVRRRIQPLVFSDEPYLFNQRILSGCTPEVKSTPYLTLERPKLEYASCVWNPHTQCNIDKIKMVQCREVGFVHNDYSRFSHLSPLMKALGWDSLENRRLTNQVLMFYKIYAGFVGISLAPEVSCNIRASRLPNCAPFCQLATLNDTYKYYFLS